MHELKPSVKQSEDDIIKQLSSFPSRRPRGMCPARVWNWDALSSYQSFEGHDPKHALLVSFENVKETCGIHKSDLNLVKQSLEQAMYFPKPGNGRKG